MIAGRNTDERLSTTREPIMRNKRTAFSRNNQPRTCAECGKRYADSTYRDTGERVCADCYDKAGYENAHQDGHHTADMEGFQEDCPMCVKTTETVPAVVIPDADLLSAQHMSDEHKNMRVVDCPMCQDELRVMNHENGGHEDQLLSVCPLCIEHAKPLVAAKDQKLAETPEQRIAGFMVKSAEKYVTERATSVADRLRRLADEFEQDAKRMLDVDPASTYNAVDIATNLVNQFNWLVGNAAAHELIRLGMKMNDAKRMQREAAGE